LPFKTATTGIEHLRKVAHRVDAARFQHLARNHVARRRQGITERETFAAQIVETFDAAVGARDDRGVVVGHAFAFGLE
jgi:hypothetical protein